MRIISLSFLLFFLISCEKQEDRACFKTAGDDSSVELLVDSFDKLYLKEHMEFVLVQDTVEKIVISGGRNLLNFIDAKVIDGRLEIYNTNKCSFLRSYKKKIKVEIHFIQLINIHYEGTETLINKGTLQLNWLTVLIRDGAGPVKLNFNANTIYTTIAHGWGDFTYSGNVNYANFNVRSNGYCDTYGLNVSDSITVISNTPGISKVNANGAQFRAEIDGSGDIWYKGNPNGSPIVYQYGTGEVISKN
jgi:hypothetical protein